MKILQKRYTFILFCIGFFLFNQAITQDKKIITHDISRSATTLQKLACLYHGGTTYTTIKNKTPFAIEVVNIDGYVHFSEGPLENVESWGQTGFILPKKKYKVLSVPRGCSHFNEDVIFKITIDIPPVGTIVLEEMIRYKGEPGNSLLGTDDLVGLAVKSGDAYKGDKPVPEEWHKNTRKHRFVYFTKGKEKIKVVFYSYFTGGYDDIWCEITYESLL